MYLEKSLWISEMTDSNVIRDGKNDKRIHCYKTPVLHYLGNSTVLFKSELLLVVYIVIYILQTLR